MVIPWAWRTSKQIDAGLIMRLKFVAAAVRYPSLAKTLAKPDAQSPFGELMGEQPQTIGALIWPYQCAAWETQTRFERIAQHLDVVRQIPGLTLSLDDKLVLADLGHVSPSVSIILDRPPWLSREGHLTLSLFKGEFRAFTVSFSLVGGSEPSLFIGGLQGRQSDQILDLYRDLTKDFAGMRPRDFLLETLRMFATKIGVQHIYAVTDDQKIARHKYFAGKEAGGFSYDDVWIDRGGTRVAPTHFELPLAGSRRPLEEVPSKKRSMYRRRYEMLDSIESAWPSDLTSAERRRFVAT